MTSRNIRALKAAILVLILTGLVGCQGTIASSAGSKATITHTPEPVVFSYPGDDWVYPSPFARYSRGPGYIRMSLLFDTLTWKDENGVIPWLAEDWEMSEDGKRWTFALRSDVRWHDGQSFTADDVAFTFSYVQKNEAEIVWSGEMAKVQDVQAIDQHTVRFTLADPIAGPHFNLFGSVPIIPRHVWDGVEDPGQVSGAGDC